MNIRPITDLPFTLACVASLGSVERVQRASMWREARAVAPRMHRPMRGRRSVLEHLGDLAIGDWFPVQIDDPARLIEMSATRWRMTFRGERSGVKTWRVWRVS
jgi:hypothetical protein